MTKIDGKNKQENEKESHFTELKRYTRVVRADNGQIYETKHLRPVYGYDGKVEECIHEETDERIFVPFLRPIRADQMVINPKDILKAERIKDRDKHK